MSDATWCVHPLHEKYEVSSDGRIRNARTGREMTPFRHPNGYLQTVISSQGKRVGVRFHRMVCETFHGLPETSDLQVRHLNGMQDDNRADNLAWGTLSENMQDKNLHGTNHWLNQTHCKSGHAFDDRNTRIVHGNERQCRECDRLAHLARRAALRESRSAPI